MTRTQYQAHFIAGFGNRWSVMSNEKRAHEWAIAMINRRYVGLLSWSNPWKYEGDPMKLIIPGKPISKNRPRFARRGKFTTTYSDQETESGKFFLLCREQVTKKFEGPLRVHIVFYIPRPKSHYGTGRNENNLKPSAPSYPDGSRQDLDNLEKFAYDCLNGLAWNDDRQIVENFSRKVWAINDAKTCILIEEMT